MAAVRCPRCGTVLVDFQRQARCRQCHEALRKCRYCVHYDFRLMDCTHLARREDERILDADEVLHCPRFTTILGTVSTALRSKYLLGIGAIAAILLVVIGLQQWIVLSAKSSASASLQVTASAPEISDQDEGFDVAVYVLNKSDHQVRAVQVLISGRSISHLVCQYVNPAEAYLEGSTRAYTAGLGNIEPGEIRSVVFHFLSDRAGKIELAVHVTAENIQKSSRSIIKGNIVP